MYDLILVGAGLAGLTLARQLLLKQPQAKILHLEKRKQIPGSKQKVGESTVQVGGYYFGKTLDMEEHLLCDHFMKYNLRFLWRNPGTAGDDYLDYSQGFIQKFSNVGSYQIDRNLFETELIRRNQTHPHYQLCTGVSQLDITLGEGVPHRVTYVQDNQTHEATAAWLVDTSGRKRTLARKREMDRPVEINHGSSWFWIDGILNLEKLTRLSHDEALRHKSRRQLGHLPVWLSTSQMMGEGYWFWIITLQKRTSLGLVYDQNLIKPSEVNTPEKLLPWLLERFPLLEPALANKPVIDFTTLQSYSYDCTNTINRHKWAVSGEAGRFTDPLYSPGSDGIAIHNTLIVDAILSRDDQELGAKVGLFDSMMNVTFRSFVPSFQDSYCTLGDHECYYMKYTWELAVYFDFFVFPFFNQLFTNRRFLAGYFRRFAMLGPVNRGLLNYITGFYAWKKEQPPGWTNALHTNFLLAPVLDRAEKLFYIVDCEVADALAVLDTELGYLLEFARYLFAYIDAVVVGDPELVNRAAYVATIHTGQTLFDPEAIRARYAAYGQDPQPQEWSFPPCFMKRTFPRAEQTVGQPH